jgi:ubiquinol-cytochrome c reductase iron-sulfur subunit
LTAIAEGQEIKVMWRGKPVFIRHRTAQNVEEAGNAVDIADPARPRGPTQPA